MSVLAIVAGICSVVMAICTTVSAVVSVAERVVALCKEAGAIKVDINQEELGERCLAAEEKGITPESFDNDYEVYFKNVGEIDMSSVDCEKWSKQEKALKAIEVVSGALIHDIGPKSEKVILSMVNHPDSVFYNHERLGHYITLDKQGKLDLNDAMDYLNGEIISDTAQTRRELADAERTMNPMLTEGQALDIIDEYRGC